MRTLNNRSGTFDLFFKDAHAKQKKQLSPKNLMESKMGDKALTYLSLRKMVWNSYLLLFVHLTDWISMQISRLPRAAQNAFDLGEWLTQNELILMTLNH